ncbi:uncharacterized protein LOC120509458 isoform X1 [Passer montanus]|uniref:uncharacterized protein LOC120509458 isoform X1 n=1 Tax=Passer montanus TaxID=9160 RepID=UPI001961D673|nr:uncharacterized protein LOC120509458 isoform X1 [Passer montanus]
MNPPVLKTARSNSILFRFHRIGERTASGEISGIPGQPGPIFVLSTTPWHRVSNPSLNTFRDGHSSGAPGSPSQCVGTRGRNPSSRPTPASLPQLETTSSRSVDCGDRPSPASKPLWRVTGEAGSAFCLRCHTGTGWGRSPDQQRQQTEPHRTDLLDLFPSNNILAPYFSRFQPPCTLYLSVIKVFPNCDPGKQKNICCSYTELTF